MADVLVDANFLVAIGYPRDRNHDKARAFAAEHETELFIPDVVLVEAMYNLNLLGSVAATVTFSRLLSRAKSDARPQDALGGRNRPLERRSGCGCVDTVGHRRAGRRNYRFARNCEMKRDSCVTAKKRSGFEFKNTHFDPVAFFALTRQITFFFQSNVGSIIP